jgi:myo-inositol-1(or 4)-monophosphatase
MPMPPHAELDAIISIAGEAARIVRDHYGKVARETKRGEEAVTEADRASQRFIVQRLRERWPDDGIIGEENDSGGGITNQPAVKGSRTWVIDPIDGTNNFVAGLGNFAVCIGLLHHGAPSLGVVLDVCRNDCYAAARGHGAWLNGRQTKALDTPLSERSLLMMTSNCLNESGEVPRVIGRWLRNTTWKMRMLGSAALEAVQVASGVAHAALTVNGKLWDIAAAAAILEESGAVLTGLDGKPLFPVSTSGYTGAKVPFLAAAPKAQATFLQEITKFW